MPDSAAAPAPSPPSLASFSTDGTINSPHNDSARHIITSLPDSASSNINTLMPASNTNISALSNGASPAPAMKERTVSSSTDRSGRAAALMSVSPSIHARRLGSRSPTSIPSSPTSVHSSSSAIFERDVELPPSHLPLHSSHPTHPPNPHRTPRSKATEPLEQSVPSVLDSAATLLASTDELEESFIAVEAPVPLPISRGSSALGSPIGKGSRSPSPTTSAGRTNRTSMLLNLPSPVQSSIVPLTSLSPSGFAARSGHGSPFGGSPTRPLPPPLITNQLPMNTAVVYPDMGVNVPVAAPSHQRSSTPTSAGASTQYESAASSPTTTTVEHNPYPLPDSASVSTPTTNAQFSAQQLQGPRPRQAPQSARASVYSAGSPPMGAHAQLSNPHAQLSHPPSPSHTAQKRLSFISYSDILASTPISTLPLSSLTSPGNMEPPPHLPSVSLSVSSVGITPGPVSAVGMGSRSVSLSASAAGSARNSMFIDGMWGPGGLGPADVKEPDSTDGLASDDAGGEWEREGLGRGLEERLEALMVSPVGGGGKA